MQQKLVQALPPHGGLLRPDVSTGLADMQPLHRAYSFSRDFSPDPGAERSGRGRRRSDGLHVDPCERVPGYLVRP